MQNSVLQRLAAAHEQFQQLQLRKAGIMALSDVISTLLVTPVIVLDRFFEILSETGISMDDAQTLARRVASHDGRALFPRAGDHPAVVNLDGTELLIGHAADGNDTLGFVLALRSEAAFDETDTRVVELACGTFTLDVLRHRTEVEAEVRLHRDFGDALASAGAGSTLSQRAALLGIRATQENQVLRVLIAGVEPELGRRDAYEVALLMRKRLQEVHRDAVVTSLGAGEFAVIVPRASVTSRGLATVTAAVRKSIADGLFALRGFDDPVSVAIGVGTAATDVDGLQASNSEAVRALTVLRSVGASNDDLEIGDAGSFALIASVGADDRVPFVDRYLTPLVEYDGRRNSGLIETLRTYFAEVGSVQRTADALFLHISTVRYRLSRIEEIANISLRNEEDRLCLQIAMRLAGFAHSLPRADD